MSSHADTIRKGLSEYDSEIDSVRKQHEALDALLAGNQRLREALELARSYVAYASVTLAPNQGVLQQVDEALAGDAE